MTATIVGKVTYKGDVKEYSNGRVGLGFKITGSDKWFNVFAQNAEELKKMMPASKGDEVVVEFTENEKGYYDITAVRKKNVIGGFLEKDPTDLERLEKKLDYIIGILEKQVEEIE